MRQIAIALVFAASAAFAQTPDAPAPSAVPETKPPAARKLLPVDEGGTDASWVTFRARLLDALKRGDRKTLLAVVDRNIVNSMEAERGIAAGN
jgi:hypothetical protein